MEIFQHFIITKFNLKIKGVFQDRNKNNINTDKWRKDRIKLFDKFCFPSIVNQSNLNFKWLVLFDKTTPTKYKKIIEKYKKFKNFVPIFTTWKEKAIKDILNRIDKKTKFIITTRIDNDDSFHKDAIKIIQKNFRKQSFEFLDFPFGYSFRIDNNKLYLQEIKGSHFITLIEKKNKKGFKTVFFTAHNKIKFSKLIKNVKKISNKPYWLEVIHNSNIYNNYMEGKTYSLKNLKNFNIKIDIK